MYHAHTTPMGMPGVYVFAMQLVRCHVPHAGTNDVYVRSMGYSGALASVGPRIICLVSGDLACVRKVLRLQGYCLIGTHDFALGRCLITDALFPTTETCMLCSPALRCAEALLPWLTFTLSCRRCVGIPASTATSGSTVVATGGSPASRAALEVNNV